MVSAKSLLFAASVPSAVHAGGVNNIVMIEGKGNSCSEGYAKIGTDGVDGNLNKGGFGKDPFMCVKTGEARIYEIVVVARHSHMGSDTKCEDNGREDEAVWQQIGRDKGSNGDANQENNGPHLYICYRKKKKNDQEMPIMDIKLANHGDCNGGGWTQVSQNDESNGNLNQGNIGDDIFMCFKRQEAPKKQCQAQEIEGKWIKKYTVPTAPTEDEWIWGLEKSTSTTKSESWKESLEVKVSQKWTFLGQEGGIEITGSFAHDTSTSVTDTMTEHTENKFKVTWGADDVDKTLWQWQWGVSSTDCEQPSVESAAREYALTHGAYSPPCCIPGYQTDRYYTTCVIKDAMVKNGENRSAPAIPCKVQPAETTEAPEKPTTEKPTTETTTITTEEQTTTDQQSTTEEPTTTEKRTSTEEPTTEEPTTTAAACPGGSLESCVDWCPMDDPRLFNECTSSCLRRCDDEASTTTTPFSDCPGGSLDACVDACPMDDPNIAKICVGSCTRRCPSEDTTTRHPEPTTEQPDDDDDKTTTTLAPTPLPYPGDEACRTCQTMCAPCQACVDSQEGECLKCWKCWDWDDDELEEKDGKMHKHCDALDEDHDWDDDKVRCLARDVGRDIYGGDGRRRRSPVPHNTPVDCRACWNGPQATATSHANNTVLTV